MDNEDFFLSMRGMKDKVIDEKRFLRRVAVFIASSNIDTKGRSMYELFPIEKDDELKELIKKEKEKMKTVALKTLEEFQKNPNVNMNKINLN